MKMRLLFWIVFPLVVLAAGLPAFAEGPAASPQPPSLDLLRDPEVVELVRSIPVQEAGRVKPLDTMARFRLLRFSGKTTISMPDPADPKKKISLSAAQWLLLSWFRPDLAKDLPVFVVDNSDAIVEIGLSGKEKRDRYSYNELLPGRTALVQKRQEVADIETKDRTPVQRILGKLGSDFLDYEMMLGHFDFARSPFGDELKSVPPEIVPAGGPTPRIVPLLKNMIAHIKAHPEAGAPMANPWLRNFYFHSMLGAMMAGNAEQTLRIFPTNDPTTEVWQGPGPIIQGALDEGKLADEDAAWLTKYEDWYLASGDATAFKAKLHTLVDDINKAFLPKMVQAVKAQHLRENPNAQPLSDADAQTWAQGRVSHIGLEISYNKTEYFYNALLYFWGGALLLGLSMVAPRALWGRICVWLCTAAMLIGEVYAVWGIVVRCFIMERPPITTLYETILFIATAAVLFGLIAEAMTRKMIGMAVACVAGTVGMLLSIRFMNMEATDTLQQLQAVLITNFWLATHVPTINLGYAAGMFAAILSMIYFALRLFQQVKPGDKTAKDFTNIGYGFVMVGLFLSLVGTVLGGIWANYSWGRFWGWDPKENGALMIVIMNLVILHARLGGYIREVGFHCCCIVLGMIVAFSWFGVNQLNVGLHTYGFTEGIWFWLCMFWGLQLLILAYGITLSFLDRAARRKPKETLPVGRVVSV